MMPLKGPFAARFGSVWIHWWSPVASANWSTCCWVTFIHSVVPSCCPTSLSRSAGSSKTVVIQDLSRCSVLQHISAGSRLQRSHARAAERLRCVLLLAATLSNPCDEVGPPRIRVLLSRLQPELRIRLIHAPHPIARPRVARRVHQRRDVAAGRQDEAQVADSEQAGAAVTGLPR